MLTTGALAWMPAVPALGSDLKLARTCLVWDVAWRMPSETGMVVADGCVAAKGRAPSQDLLPVAVRLSAPSGTPGRVRMLLPDGPGPGHHAPPGPVPGPLLAASCQLRLVGWQAIPWRRLSKPGFSVRKLVDDLCKHPRNLCTTWG